MNAITKTSASRNISPIRVLFEKWEALNARCAAEPGTGDCNDPIYGEISDTMDRILALTPQSMGDLALQILVADDRGDMSMNVWQERLAEKAKTLTDGTETDHAFNKTDQSIGEANDLLSAAYELAIEHDFLGSSDPAAQYFLTLIRVARERVLAAMESHSAEGRTQSKARAAARSDDAQDQSHPTTGRAGASLRAYVSDMQDKQCLLTGVLEAIQRIDNEEGNDGALTALIQTAIRQADEVYVGLDSVNLPGTGGADTAKGGGN